MRKLFLGLGTVAAVTVPVIAVVACSTALEKIPNQIDTEASAISEGYKYTNHKPIFVKGDRGETSARYVKYFISEDDYWDKSSDFVSVVTGTTQTKSNPGVVVMPMVIR